MGGVTLSWLADVASVAGVVIAVVGFGVTLWNVARSIRAAERAKEAAKEARASARFLETLARWQAFNADKALGHVIASLEKT